MYRASRRNQCDALMLFKLAESNQLNTQYFYGCGTVMLAVKFHACVQELERTFTKGGTR